MEIKGRQDPLKRCFENIINNALTYGTNVEIKVEKKLNNCIVFVDDNGKGISQNEYLNVFKPFYRIDKSRSQNKSVWVWAYLSQTI